MGRLFNLALLLFLTCEPSSMQPDWGISANSSTTGDVVLVEAIFTSENTETTENSTTAENNATESPTSVPATTDETATASPLERTTETSSSPPGSPTKWTLTTLESDWRTTTAERTTTLSTSPRKPDEQQDHMTNVSSSEYLTHGGRPSSDALFFGLLAGLGLLFLLSLAVVVGGILTGIQAGRKEIALLQGKSAETLGKAGKWGSPEGTETPEAEDKVRV